MTTEQESTDLGELVTHAQLGDPLAFERLYLRHRGLIRGVVVMEGFDRSLVEDVVQEVFAQVWRRLPALRDVERFRPWLLQITRRTLIDQSRKALRSPRLVPDSVAVELLPTCTPGPEECVDAIDLADRLSSAIAMMSDRDAALLQQAVERHCGLPEVFASKAPLRSANKVALHRARLRLAHHLAATA